jgi:sugar phosphate isomerase/epimerase
MKKARSTAAFVAKIIIGDILFALGFNLFLEPNGLNAGGLSGLAMVLVHFQKFGTVGIITAVVNLPLFIIGGKRIGKKFFLGSLVGMVALSATLELLSPFVEHANKIGLNVVVENMRVLSGKMQCHRYCMTAEELCDLADTLGIGVCWDFGHAHLSGLKQSKALEYVGKRLKVVHINDNGGIEDDHVMPFSGGVNWKDAMHGLALAGYDGLFNFELSVRTPAAMRKAHAKFVLEIANELMSYIE